MSRRIENAAQLLTTSITNGHAVRNGRAFQAATGLTAREVAALDPETLAALGVAKIAEAEADGLLEVTAVKATEWSRRLTHQVPKYTPGVAGDWWGHQVATAATGQVHAATHRGLYRFPVSQIPIGQDYVAPTIEDVEDAVLDLSARTAAIVHRVLGRHVVQEYGHIRVPDIADGPGWRRPGPQALMDRPSAREKIIAQPGPRVSEILLGEDGSTDDRPGYVIDASPVTRDRHGLLKPTGARIALLRSVGIADAIMYGTIPDLETMRHTIEAADGADKLEIISGGIMLETSRGLLPIQTAVLHTGANGAGGSWPMETNISIATLKSRQMLAFAAHGLISPDAADEFMACANRAQKFQAYLQLAARQALSDARDRSLLYLGYTLDLIDGLRSSH